MDRKLELVSRTVAVIEERLDTRLELAEVATRANYSKYHLHRTFAQVTGITVHSYIRRRQLSRAAQLLVHSEKPIISIAYEAGYETQQAFSGAFRAMYKKAPGAFREAGVYYTLQNAFSVAAWGGLQEACSEKIRAECAAESDVAEWMALARLVADGYPYLDEAAYKRELIEYIGRGEALAVKQGGRIIGSLLFSNRTGSIDFIGVHPLCRKKAVYEALLARAAECFGAQRTISVTTYRAGDKADTGYRRAVEGLGFLPAELLTEFGYPTQRFILQGGRERTG